MSTLRVSTIQDTAGSNSSTPSQVFSGRAKAWVAINGAGTATIRGSYNVSSIVDQGVGDYSVNYSITMPDTNYLILLGVDDNGAAYNNTTSLNGACVRNGFTTTTGTRLTNSGVNPGSYRMLIDAGYISCAIF